MIANLGAQVGQLGETAEPHRINGQAGLVALLGRRVLGSRVFGGAAGAR